MKNCIAVWFVCCGCLSWALADERPNFVIIMADDMGFSDIGCYGSEIATPHLDSLAASGLRFSQFYNNAKCEPTRASLLTGKYPHQAGASSKVVYRAPTFGEVLRTAGYRTLMTGKWHAGQKPFDRGFDRHFGLTDGCCNFFNPGVTRPNEPAPSHKRFPRRWAIDGTSIQPFCPQDPDFYTTDAFTDYAVDYLQQYRHEDRPFVLYVAYTAPHYPMHAWPEDIQKYRHKYQAGWQALRQRRYEGLDAANVFSKLPEISPVDEQSPAWETLTAEQQDAWDLRMAVYAAMIDRMDQNIGRLLAKLDEIGKAENTVVMFFSDNGSESDNSDWSTDKAVSTGGVDSFRTVGQPWANASNTPFRKYKTFLHEGGIASPLIVRWPQRITAASVTHQPAHLVDVMATLVDLADATYPQRWQEEPLSALPGISWADTFDSPQQVKPRQIAWRWRNAAALRQGDWKLVRDKSPDAAWELYNLADDRTELHDRAMQEPQRVAELQDAWNAWDANAQP